MGGRADAEGRIGVAEPGIRLAAMAAAEPEGGEPSRVPRKPTRPAPSDDERKGHAEGEDGDEGEAGDRQEHVVLQGPRCDLDQA
jgi:hypothetical protein